MTKEKGASSMSPPLFVYLRRIRAISPWTLPLLRVLCVKSFDLTKNRPNQSAEAACRISFVSNLGWCVFFAS